ncbi:PREDICTED: leucine-rich repeat and fibronectin type III domain-containing protein 1-like isoform X1 [Branchiostoma belcheri]|uniref:Leucine-rich repeat and fibronectin type III domain-containing protein 1-like isoform X1 n=1 Tax=Branchiostoma belcheri TaxID=7741 RepID=A0A6P4Z5H7_BRABE|nr:PREDICTED: leucine-rich repeat and fibronectin type III domain-containing protein 1-like isoform X1 [Branchiostoma belcheri]XP_019631864.1 PREDICTED: leucine-rich repeat and fibronectin type III domain-containing protein 1-like isoform X1 [Branchiostoma belcheri]XP_019631866.1 PREDICTED: leucine-rich repeat and fibronectin type III domain-containing protein 1-like isoform X1 [Branchiostoma belcheri]
MAMVKEFNMRYVFLLVSCLLLQHLATVTSCPTSPACSCDGTDVNCNSLQLNVIPTNIPTDTTALSLSQNQIAAFFVDIFCSFDSLQTLDLSYNHLLTLEEAAFCRLSTIVTLDLSHNNLHDIHESTFDGLSSVQTLRLSYNNLRNLPNGSFSDLAGLKTIDLSHNSLTELPENIFLSNDLNNLDLSYNYLTSFPLSQALPLDKSFASVFNYQLKIDSNRITTFPSSASAHFEYYVWATVTMADNAISCDCELLPFANMHKAGIYSPFDWPVYLACGSPDWLQGQQIYYLDTAKLTCIAPNITRTAQDQDVNVVQGNSTILSCEATGLPNPTIVWTLPNGDTVDSSTEGNTKFTLSESGALYIANTEPGDEGSYKCEAENTYGSVAIYHNVTVMKRLMSETVDTSTQNTLLSSTQAMTSPVNESENSIWNSFIPDEAVPITVIVSTMVGSVLVIGASIAGVNVCIAKCTAAKATQVVPI